MKLNSFAGRLLLALFIVSAAYFAGGVYGVFDFLVNAQNEAALPLDFGIGGTKIYGIPTEAAEAGILRNDVLLEMNGRPFTGYTVMREEVRKYRPGQFLPVAIRRASDGAVAYLQIRLRPRLDAPAALLSWVWKIGTQILFPVFCMVIGFWVVLNRHRDLSAWMLLVIMLASADLIPTGSWSGGWSAAVSAWDIFLGSALPVAMLLFAIHFPERAEFDRRRPWFKWILLLPIAVCNAIYVWFAFFKQIDMSMNEGILPLLPGMNIVQRILGMIAISCFFTLLGKKSATATNPDARRRLRLLWSGAAVGLTPAFILAMRGLITGQDWENGVPEWALLVTISALTIFPLTLGHVIVVQRAMDVSMVVRQSMKYALAKSGLNVLRGLIVAGAIVAILGMQNDPGHHAVALSLSLSGIALLVVRGKVSQRASVWMDRRFFREAYSGEQVLSELSGEVRKFVETAPLLETVTSRISATLHVSRISVLLANGRDGFSGGGSTLGSASSAIRRLLDTHEAAVVYFDDPDSWVHGADAREQKTLQSLDAQLLLPLNGREKLMGVIAMGPKLSEEPYSATDIALLQNVAAQTGLAIENNQLVAKLAFEAAQKERMNRELEIAREVQQRLFPQKFPNVGGLDCCGKCRAALGVGGDYFDFLTLPDGKLGVAIGDVSGKGISAALLMASLRSSLRGQTIGGHGELSALMVNMNHLVFEASASNRYATFFYGEYDPATHRLEFVNAGHNAPVILRGDEVLRLEASGPVVGLLPHTAYTQDAIDLRPGDIFLGYTDGISEAMNEADEEWGEEAMIASARRYAGLDAGSMIDRIMVDADGFADGAEQHDDMTLLVMKLAG